MFEFRSQKIEFKKLTNWPNELNWLAQYYSFMWDSDPNLLVAPESAFRHMDMVIFSGGNSKHVIQGKIKGRCLTGFETNACRLFFKPDETAKGVLLQHCPDLYNANGIMGGIPWQGPALMRLDLGRVDIFSEEEEV